MYSILNYVEFRTNHEPYMVHGVVHGGVRLPQAGRSETNIEISVPNSKFRTLLSPF